MPFRIWIGLICYYAHCCVCYLFDYHPFPLLAVRYYSSVLLLAGPCQLCTAPPALKISIILKYLRQLLLPEYRPSVLGVHTI